MKWKFYLFWSGVFFLPFMVLGEGIIGLIVIGLFGILNGLVERGKKLKAKANDGYEQWKKYRKETLEEMK